MVWSKYFVCLSVIDVKQSSNYDEWIGIDKEKQIVSLPASLDHTDWLIEHNRERLVLNHSCWINSKFFEWIALKKDNDYRWEVTTIVIMDMI